MEKWIPAWRYVAIDYNHQLGLFENVTQKCVFTNNLSGSALRIRFSNRYNQNGMRIANVSADVRNRIIGKRSAWAGGSKMARTVADRLFSSL